MTEVVICEALTRTYQSNSVPVHALREVDLTLHSGEFVSLAGPSGSGKSTLLNLIGGLDHATSGQVIVGGIPLANLNEAELSDLRLNKMGFVFQAYNLIPVLSAVENIEFTMQLQGVSGAERRSRSSKIMQKLGLEGLEHRRPAQLSGGQQQRVAIGRALVTEPLLLLADEPSANLDSKAAEDLMQLLRGLNDEQGVTILTATHDPLVISYARRHLGMKDGQIASDTDEG